MSDLVDGSAVPWDFVSGDREVIVTVNPLVAERARQRRAEAAARLSVELTAAAARTQADLQRATQAIAATGLSARRLGQRISDNMRRFSNQEGPTT